MHPGCTIEQVFLYRDPIDFRKAIDGLNALVELELGLSPFASALYVCGKSVWSRTNSPGREMIWRPQGPSVCRSLGGFWRASICGEINRIKH